MQQLGDAMSQIGSIEAPPRITPELRLRFVDLLPGESLTCSLFAEAGYRSHFRRSRPVRMRAIRTGGSLSTAHGRYVNRKGMLSRS